MKNEIILYQAKNLTERIEVKVENDTVWLNRLQIATLFNRDVKTIGKHINNALKEELAGFSVVANFATTAKDGKVYQVEHYNLDLQKYNSQYPPIKIEIFKKSHDRFLIIDKKEVYHFGASLKDLGKKWFAVTQMDISSIKILDKLEQLNIRK